MVGSLRKTLSGFFVFVLLSLFSATAMADHYLVGRWLDSSQVPEITIEIYMEDGDFFMFKKTPQGQTASKKIERKVDHGVMTFRTLDKNYITAAYVVVSASRELKILDREGHVIATPELLAFEPEPHELTADDDHHGEETDTHAATEDDHHGSPQKGGHRD